MEHRPAQREPPPNDDEPEDDRPTSRRPRRKKAIGDSAAPRAALMVGGIGLAGLLLIGCCGGGFYYLSSGGGDGGGLVDGVLPSLGSDGWERKTVPDTTMSVEMPEPNPGAMTEHRNPFTSLGVRGLYSEREGPDGVLRFMAGPALGGEPRSPLTVEKVVQGARKAGKDARVVREFKLRGQTAAVIMFYKMSLLHETDVKTDTIVLFVQNPTEGVTHFGVGGNGIDENYPDVKQFFDSVRVAR